MKLKKKMSEKKKGDKNNFYGKSHTDKTILKLKNIGKNRDMSIFNKKVIQMDKNTGEFIKIWNSISEAAEFLTGDKKQGSRISRACKGIYKSTMGFNWKYE